MRSSIVLLLIFACAAFAAAFPAAQSHTAKSLDIYVIDVEGGNATLFVSPSGESLLMDTGNVAPGAVRDAGRIMAAIQDAGLQQVDHLIITHWHGDHFGGLAALASHITIREFIGHGPNVQPGALGVEFVQNPCQPAYAKASHNVAQHGDKLGCP